MKSQSLFLSFEKMVVCLNKLLYRDDTGHKAPYAWCQDISLNCKEEAFVLNNFDAFAKYFAPRATDTVEREVVQCVEDLVSAVERA